MMTNDMEIRVKMMTMMMIHDKYMTTDIKLYSVIPNDDDAYWLFVCCVGIDDLPLMIRDVW